MNFTSKQLATLSTLEELLVKDKKFPSKKKLSFWGDWNGVEALVTSQVLTIDAEGHHVVLTGRGLLMNPTPVNQRLFAAATELLEACKRLYSDDLDRNDRWTVAEFLEGIAKVGYEKSVLPDEATIRLALAVLTRSQIPGVFSRISNHEWPVEKFTISAEIMTVNGLGEYPPLPAQSPTPEKPVF